MPMGSTELPFQRLSEVQPNPISVKAALGSTITMAKLESVHSEDVENARTSVDAIVPSREEAVLLRRLRTLKGNEYEAQYFDNKQVPRGTNYRQLGNPSALGISPFSVCNTLTALLCSKCVESRTRM